METIEQISVKTEDPCPTEVGGMPGRESQWTPEVRTGRPDPGASLVPLRAKEVSGLGRA